MAIVAKPDLDSFDSCDSHEELAVSRQPARMKLQLVYNRVYWQIGLLMFWSSNIVDSLCSTVKGLFKYYVIKYKSEQRTTRYGGEYEQPGLPQAVRADPFLQTN